MLVLKYFVPQTKISLLRLLKVSFFPKWKMLEHTQLKNYIVNKNTFGVRH